MEYQLLNHGANHPNQFQGCGIALTNYTGVVTGIGSTLTDAFETALDQLATLGSKENILANRLANDTSATMEFGHAPDLEPSDERTYHVSIRYKVDADNETTAATSISSEPELHLAVQGIPDEEQFEVLTYTFCDGWVNCWTTFDNADEETPTFFASPEEALIAIQDYLNDCKIAVKRKDMVECPDTDELRIVDRRTGATIPFDASNYDKLTLAVQ